MRSKLFWQYLVLEALLVIAGGAALFWGTKGIFFSALILTAINYFHSIPSSFWFWELLIISFALFGIIINIFFDYKTQHLRVVKVYIGSTASLLTAGVFLTLIPAFALWSFLIGLPLIFTYRQMPRTLYSQILFKFISPKIPLVFLSVKTFCKATISLERVAKFF